MYIKQLSTFTSLESISITIDTHHDTKYSKQVEEQFGTLIKSQIRETAQILLFSIADDQLLHYADYRSVKIALHNRVQIHILVCSIYRVFDVL